MQTVEQAIDPHFRVEVVAKTPNPQQLVWLSAHQCVCEGIAIDDPSPSEEDAGKYVVKHLLAGHRGHYSPLEAPQISFNVSGFNHRTMQQIRTHRIGVHYSVQSLRYTSDRFVQFSKESRGDEYIPGVLNLSREDVEMLEALIYLRPVGAYTDRQGKRYDYTPQQRENDLAFAAHSIQYYARRMGMGYSEEHAAGLLPMDTRQHWVMSFNVRSLMHLLDLRAAKNAQLECQQLCQLIFPHFKKWVPSLAEWYETNRWEKARLSP